MRNLFRFLPLALALLLVSLGLSCTCSDPKPPSIRFTQGKLVADFAQSMTTAVRSSDGKWALGTKEGKVLLYQEGAQKADEITDVKDAVVKLSFSQDQKKLFVLAGRTAYWWSLAENRLLRSVRGPEQLMDGVIDDQDRAAYFGTERGFVLRWAFDQAEALAVEGVRCTAWAVPSDRRRLPEAKRCTAGTFGETPKGQQVCLYPVTQMRRRGKRLAVACGDGVISFLQLESRQIRRYQDESVGLINYLDDDILLLAARQGQLTRLELVKSTETQYSFGKVLARRRLVQVPLLIAASKKYWALVSADRVEIFLRDHIRASGAVKTKGKIVWMGLQQQAEELYLLLADGRLVRHGFEQLPEN